MSDSRCLRSKRLRAALYMAAGGRCQECGVELGSGWHADHIEPWCETERTNAHEMRALCPACNLRKGARSMKTLRQHQQEILAAARDIGLGNRKPGHVVAWVTPGGGKSLAASLFANELLNHRICNRVCWLCPRLSLTSQAEEDFINRELGLTREIRKADNTTPLVRHPACGYVTTYQSVAASPDLHRQEFERERYVLILDEPHHLADDGCSAWHAAIKPLFDAAVVTLSMSGTLERHDRKPIPFLNYNGGPIPSADVNYPRRVAFSEQAVLPIAFEYQDGTARYIDVGRGFDERAVDVSAAVESEYGGMMDAILGKSEYRDALLRRGLDHWVNFRASVYRSRAIVICDSQSMARDVQSFIKQNYQAQVALAICDEPDAHRVLAQFRHNQRGEVLVTVGMAYEGLDVKDCTHLVCLTRCRSYPWLEQAFARVTRVDPKCGLPYKAQHAYVFVPDDPRMRVIVERMKDEQPAGLREEKETDGNGGGGQGSLVVALGAEPGEVTHGDVDGRFDDGESRFIESIRAKMPSLMVVPPRDLLSALHEYKAAGMGQRGAVESQAPTLSQREDELRHAIESQARSLDATRFNGKFGSTNMLIIKRFNKSREAMSVTELQDALKFLGDLKARGAL